MEKITYEQLLLKGTVYYFIVKIDAYVYYLVIWQKKLMVKFENLYKV